LSAIALLRLVRSQTDQLPRRHCSHSPQHAGHEAVEEVQVRAADRAARHLDDRVARMLDPRVGYFVAADVLLAVPAERFHGISGRDAEGSKTRTANAPTPIPVQVLRRHCPYPANGELHRRKRCAR
jgi:hypothetical protein